jgi:hypothetical protein
LGCEIKLETKQQAQIKLETNAAGLTDREQFGTALTSGRLEILVHDLGAALGTLADKVTLGFHTTTYSCEACVLQTK